MRKATAPIQQYRGDTVTGRYYTGPEGELTVDITKKTVVVHDGKTAGGTPLQVENLTYSATRDYAYPTIVYYNGTYYKWKAVNGPTSGSGVHAPTETAYWTAM